MTRASVTSVVNDSYKLLEWDRQGNLKTSRIRNKARQAQIMRLPYL